MNCVVCGKEIEKSMYSNAILCSSECFIKHLWERRIAEKDKYIVIQGECYSDGGNVKNPGIYDTLGCAGRRFWIRFKDGRVLTTNNLWCGGKVPDEFRKDFPDTAEFFVPSGAGETCNSEILF